MEIQTLVMNLLFGFGSMVLVVLAVSMSSMFTFKEAPKYYVVKEIEVKFYGFDEETNPMGYEKPSCYKAPSPLIDTMDFWPIVDEMDVRTDWIEIRCEEAMMFENKTITSFLEESVDVYSVARLFNIENCIKEIVEPRKFKVSLPINYEDYDGLSLA